MRTPIALHNLHHQLTRTLIAVLGIGFALVLMFMQLGFLGALLTSATQLFDRLEFDAVILSRQYLDINRARTFPRDRMYQAMTVPGVERVIPVGIGYQLWKNVDETTQKETQRTMMMLAVDPNEPLTFRARNLLPPNELFDALPKLNLLNTVLTDRTSRKEFGTITTGTVRQLGRQTVTVMGQFRIGTGFGADGLLLTSMATYRQVLGVDPREKVSLGLIQFKPDIDPVTTIEQLNALLPPDVQVVSRSDLFHREQRHWIQDTSIGIIFVLGVLVAFVVGVVFVYQVMSSDIASRMGEFATLKAMGYTDGYISGVVLQQAIMLGMLSYGLALILSLGLYELTRQSAGLPMVMNGLIIGFVLVLGLGMCALSGKIAVRKVKHADPADLF